MLMEKLILFLEPLQPTSTFKTISELRLNMCGKLLPYILLLSLHYTVKTDRTGEIKAGLLYEKTIENPVIINPTYHIFTRRIDLQTIRDAVQLTQQFTISYKNFCDRVNAIID